MKTSKFKTSLLVLAFFFIKTLAFPQSCITTLDEAFQLYNAQEYEQAKVLFEKGLAECENKDLFQGWIKKCNDNLNAPAKSIGATKTKASNKMSCDKLFAEGKKMYDQAQDVATFQKALNSFHAGLQGGCDDELFTYWKNICITNIAYYNATLEVVPKTIEFSASGGSKTITVKSNFPVWNYDQLSVNDLMWLSPKKEGQETFVITCTANGSVKEKKGVITVRAGNKSTQIEIVQKAKENLYPEVMRLLVANINSNHTAYSSFKYKGEKNNKGQRNGLGVELSTEGELFLGKFVNGEFSNGIYISPDFDNQNKRHANKYQVGNFSNFKLHGEGRCYDQDGVLSYQIDFYNDSPIDGTWWKDDRYPAIRFEILEDSAGYFLGETKDGIPFGKGIYIKKQGDIWYGEWTNGAKYLGVEIKVDGATKLCSEF